MKRIDLAILLDTSLLIQHVRLRKVKNTLMMRAIAQFGPAAVSAITMLEYNVGELVADRRPDFKGEHPQLTVLPLRDAVLRRTEYLQAANIKQNKLMALGDLLIAATAIAHNLPLLTLNVADFQHLTIGHGLRMRKVP